ncbi:hypothetical protein [Jhaorihella thermophila]|uniref:hypothetical protein n=2 Tax=Jhaorihella thermophila TaxID=488547 RepID=UPI0011B0CA15
MMDRNSGRPIALMLLIPAQIFCAAFFVVDLFRDFGDTGSMTPTDPHLYVEAFAAVTLAVSVMFEISYLLRPSSVAAQGASGEQPGHGQCRRARRDRGAF